MKEHLQVITCTDGGERFYTIYIVPPFAIKRAIYL